MKMIYLSPSTIVESFACPFLMQTTEATGQHTDADPSGNNSGNMFGGGGGAPARIIYM